MKKIVICTLALFICFPVLSQEKLSEKDKNAILEVFKMTEDGWNEGDIDKFMEGYWKSDKLVFVGSSGPVYGWETTKERYLKSYPDKTTMGNLNFDILDVYKIDTKTVLFIGKFHLERTIGDLDGCYTLVWQKINGKWLIIADHSSASSSAKAAEDEEDER